MLKRIGAKTTATMDPAASHGLSIDEAAILEDVVHVHLNDNGSIIDGSGSDGDWDCVSTSSFKSLSSDKPYRHSDPFPSPTASPSRFNAMADWGNTTTTGEAPDWNAKPDGFGSSGNDTFGADGTNVNDDFAAHSDNGAEGDDDSACYHCGNPGHMKAECPDKPSMTCNGCGEIGHMRRECPDATPMTCNVCGDPGHMRKECPDKPADVCRNCGEDGHLSSTCENERRKIDRSEVSDVSEEEVWAEIKEAIMDRDAIELKDILPKLFKHFPDMSYIELEEIFRQKDLKVWIIAMERVMLPTMLLMDLQGNLGKQWCISYRFSPKADRPKEFEAWPKSLEENMERLADAGEPVLNHRPRCLNCKEMGHISRNCPEEKIEAERAAIRCYNCDSDGHRVRDCTVPRKDRFACRNCGQSGHKSTECTEPRNADTVECNKCHEMGHFSRDCPQGGGSDRACRNCGEEGHMARDCAEPRKIICRNCDEEGHVSRDCEKPRRLQCRNCDEYGHSSRECPQPEDLSKFKCNNCGEMGHKKMQCQNPTQADIDGPLGGEDGFAGAPASQSGFGNDNGTSSMGAW